MNVTDKFDISIKNGVTSTAASKPSLTKPQCSAAVRLQLLIRLSSLLDVTINLISATVKNIKDNDGVEFSNTANEIVHQYNPYNKQSYNSKTIQTRRNNVSSSQVQLY